MAMVDFHGWYELIVAVPSFLYAVYSMGKRAGRPDEVESWSVWDHVKFFLADWFIGAMAVLSGLLMISLIGLAIVIPLAILKAIFL